MSLLDTLERRLGRFAVPNITVAVVACQAVMYVATLVVDARNVQNGAEPFEKQFQLIPERVLVGEVWRLLSFLVVPPMTNPFFLAFFLYLFYLMGTALERYWGVFRYNVFLILGYVATVGVAFILPDQAASNAYLQGSVYLAFAYLFPDFVLYVFFIMPVKIKWLALIAWIGYGWVLISGDWLERLLVLASICNFLAFFGWDIILRMRTGWRRMRRQAQQFSVRPSNYYHRCVVCGITDRTNPTMDFRYCSKCATSPCYCMDHLSNHEHITANQPDNAQKMN